VVGEETIANWGGNDRRLRLHDARSDEQWACPRSYAHGLRGTKPTKPWGRGRATCFSPIAAGACLALGYRELP
jgi:hypothetical protein